jgi:hypothetical protein
MAVIDGGLEGITSTSTVADAVRPSLSETVRVRTYSPRSSNVTVGVAAAALENTTPSEGTAVHAYVIVPPGTPCVAVLVSA